MVDWAQNTCYFAEMDRMVNGLMTDSSSEVEDDLFLLAAVALSLDCAKKKKKRERERERERKGQTEEDILTEESTICVWPSVSRPYSPLR